MNFIIESMRIFGVLVAVGFFSICAHLALTLWQAFPIEEEPSTPIYITKTIEDGR